MAWIKSPYRYSPKLIGTIYLQIDGQDCLFFPGVKQRRRPPAHYSYGPPEHQTWFG
jgi:hypothetical protein